MSKIEVDAIEPQSGTTLTIGASGDTVNIASGATITDFTSTGIDDNATSTAITIDSSEQVGIGTASPTEVLHVVGDILATGGDFKSDANNYLGFSNDTFARFVINDSEKMRIISSGNVGINTSSPSEKLEVSGNILIANNNALKINDTSSAKEILKVDNLNQTILKNANDTRDIIVRNASDDDIVRFRPNGGIAIGGSGDANTLDDYEEGTWTPTVIGTTVAGTATYTLQLGRYTKIGNIVNLYFACAWSSGTGTGNLRISGLPFSAINGTSSSYFPTGMLAGNNLTFSVNTPVVSVVNNSALIEISQMSSGANNVKVAYDSSANINASITYETN
jgi:hypothetical protein